MIPAEQVLVRRARLRLGVGVGLTIVTLLALAGGISYIALVHSQDAQIQREIAWGAASGGIPGPPSCTWVFRYQRHAFLTSNVAHPSAVPVLADAERVDATGRPLDSRLSRDGTVYYVHTERRGDAIVQVVFDSRFQLADRRHLLWGFVIAALVGLLTAVLTGVVVGRHAVAPLVEALSRQRRFVSDASHELRTPIAQVRARAQLLARRGTTARDLTRLVAATYRLGEIVDEMLLSARLAAAPGELPTAVPVDLVALATEAVAAESDLAAERGQTVTLTAPGGPIQVLGIQSALRRVISELLANALAHLPAGGKVAVSVRRVESRPSVAEVIVQDTGAGFDPSDAERIFDRFRQGSGGRAHRHGLGLALVREVVTGHGGTVTADGSPGVGATFTVRLPVAPTTGFAADERAVRVGWRRLAAGWRTRPIERG